MPKTEGSHNHENLIGNGYWYGKKIFSSTSDRKMNILRAAVKQ